MLLRTGLMQVIRSGMKIEKCLKTPTKAVHTHTICMNWTHAQTKRSSWISEANVTAGYGYRNIDTRILIQ